MKQINGIPVNIDADILGRITLKGKSIFNRKDEILVKPDATSVPTGYAAMITNMGLLVILGGKIFGNADKYLPLQHLLYI
jgi:hypothetical protein